MSKCAAKKGPKVPNPNPSVYETTPAHDESPNSLMPLSSGATNRGLGLASRLNVVGNEEKRKKKAMEAAACPYQPRRPAESTNASLDQVGARRGGKKKPAKEESDDEYESGSEPESVGSDRPEAQTRGAPEEDIDGGRSFLDRNTHTGTATVSRWFTLQELAKKGGKFTYEISPDNGVDARKMEKIVVTSASVITMYTDEKNVELGARVIGISDSKVKCNGQSASIKLPSDGQQFWSPDPEGFLSEEGNLVIDLEMAKRLASIRSFDEIEKDVKHNEDTGFSTAPVDSQIGISLRKNARPGPNGERPRIGNLRSIENKKTGQKFYEIETPKMNNLLDKLKERFESKLNVNGTSLPGELVRLDGEKWDAVPLNVAALQNTQLNAAALARPFKVTFQIKYEFLTIHA